MMPTTNKHDFNLILTKHLSSHLKFIFMDALGLTCQVNNPKFWLFHGGGILQSKPLEFHIIISSLPTPSLHFSIKKEIIEELSLEPLVVIKHSIYVCKPA